MTQSPNANITSLVSVWLTSISLFLCENSFFYFNMLAHDKQTFRKSPTLTVSLVFEEILGVFGLKQVELVLHWLLAIRSLSC